MSVAVSPDLPETSRELQSNFVWFASSFALNHGVVTTPLVIATSILDTSVAYTGNALLFVFTMLSALFLGAPLADALGLKGATLFGMSFYCIYSASFSLATFGFDAGWSLDLQWLLFCTGSSCGGIAAGVLWTAQGGYFARTVDLIVGCEPESGSQAFPEEQRQSLSATLASTFAFLYLGTEVAAKLLWSLLDYLNLEKWIIAMLYTGVGFVSVVVMAVRVLRLAPVAAPNDLVQRSKCASKIVAAMALWRDPCIFLLAGSNLTFGFSAAFMNGYVNGTYANKLGSFVPTLMAAVTTVTATLLARLFGPVAARFGKGSLVFLGACCFGAIAVAFLLPSSHACCDAWGWWLVALYILQGSGRAVYESTNKGVFADFFPEPHAVGAFANVMLQSSTAFALCFFLSETLRGRTLALLVLVFAVLTPVCFGVAIWLRKLQNERESTVDSSGDASEMSSLKA